MVTADELKRWALALPETEQTDHWGKASFRVRNKIYAVIQLDRVTAVIKTTLEERAAYTSMEPEVYQIPDSFSNLAYMTVRLDRADSEELRMLLTKAWKLAAPKKLVKAYEEGNRLPKY
jgi:hypothetical protein